MKPPISIVKSALHTQLRLELTYRVPSPAQQISSASDQKPSYDFHHDIDAVFPWNQVPEYAL